MSSKSVNDIKNTENLFEKYYLQQTNKSNLSSSTNISQTSTKSSLSSFQFSNVTDINLESSNNFIKCFNNSVIPYLSIKWINKSKKMKQNIKFNN